MNKKYKCHGIYKRYLLGYRDYLTHKETGAICKIQEYKGKFILEPHLYMVYFKIGDKYILDDILNEIVPELYNDGFIFTSVQESVQSFVKNDETYKTGF